MTNLYTPTAIVDTSNGGRVRKFMACCDPCGQVVDDVEANVQTATPVDTKDQQSGEEAVVEENVVVVGTVTDNEMTGDGDTEAPPVLVSATVVKPHPAVVAVRSLNSQHSLMSLHSHISEEHASHQEGTPQKVRRLCRVFSSPHLYVRKRTTYAIAQNPTTTVHSTRSHSNLPHSGCVIVPARVGCFAAWG